MANKNLVFFCLVAETHMGKFVVMKKTNDVEVRKVLSSLKGFFFIEFTKKSFM